MKLPRTRDLLPRVEWRDAVGSTNAELRALLDGAALPHGTLLVTDSQFAGRGRQGREWIAAPGTGLAMSLLLRDIGAAPEALGASWVPLLAGSAVATALQQRFGAGRRVGVKWPNDVHVRDELDAAAGRPGRKLCGILGEFVSSGVGAAIIVGIGVNVLSAIEDLPTPRATSLRAAGAAVPDISSFADPGGEDLADELIVAIAGELLQLVAEAVTAPEAVRTRLLRQSLTLQTEVRVHLPDGRVVDGRASGLGADGELILDLPTGGQMTVSAADVEHLR